MQWIGEATHGRRWLGLSLIAALLLAGSVEAVACGGDDDADPGPELDADAGASRPDASVTVRDAASAAPADTTTGSTAPDAQTHLCVPLEGDAGCTDSPIRPDDGGTSAEPDAATWDVSCDARKVLCKRAPPQCPFGQLPEVVETCWGGCVQVERCVCHSADECPDADHYACHMSAAHCGPYVN